MSGTKSKNEKKEKAARVSGEDKPGKKEGNAGKNSSRRTAEKALGERPAEGRGGCSVDPVIERYCVKIDGNILRSPSD